MGQFDQFANQGGPAAESADALAEARRKTDEQLRTADYSGDLPEPLSGGEHAADAVTASDMTDSGSTEPTDSAGSDPGGPADVDSASTDPAGSSDSAFSSDGGDGGD